MRFTNLTGPLNVVAKASETREKVIEIPDGKTAETESEVPLISVIFES